MIQYNDIKKKKKKFNLCLILRVLINNKIEKS